MKTVSRELFLEIFGEDKNEKLTEISIENGIGYGGIIVVGSYEIFNLSNTKKIGFRSKGANVHEFACKCKEWAWRKHFITIRSGYAEFGVWSNFAHNNISFVSMDIPLTEPEAIIKAAQWMMENSNEN